MASIDEIRAARLKKIEILKSKGIDPYPAKVSRDFSVAEVKENFKDFEYEGKEFSVAGRVMAIRGQGAILFAVIFDGTEKIQAIVKKDELPAEVFSLFTDTVDIGDFISVTGTALISKTGEQSVLMKNWAMVAKSLSPLPEKWAGLTDVDERYRKRYLDLLTDSEIRELVLKKSKFWRVTREF